MNTGDGDVGSKSSSIIMLQASIKYDLRELDERLCERSCVRIGELKVGCDIWRGA